MGGFCQTVGRLLLRSSRVAIDQERLDQPCLVLAPHPDDEVLGCGGTILRKRQRGVPVAVVYASDGSSSHRDWVAPEVMARQRRQEALLACERLGIERNQVFFLDLPDGRVQDHRDEGAERLEEVLGKLPRSQFFAPSLREPPADHRATAELTALALQHLARDGEVFEYPVWLWDQWPWAPVFPGSLRDGYRRVRDGARGLWRMRGEFTTAVAMEDVAHQKRFALNAYVSQVVRPETSPDWPTLHDVHGGDFLDRFFQSDEVFCRRSVAEFVALAAKQRS